MKVRGESRACQGVNRYFFASIMSLGRPPHRNRIDPDRDLAAVHILQPRIPGLRNVSVIVTGATQQTERESDAPAPRGIFDLAGRILPAGAPRPVIFQRRCARRCRDGEPG